MTVDQLVQAELARAVDKFPTWPTDPLHALAVLGEEFGELTKAMLQHATAPTPDDGGSHEAAHDLAAGMLKRVQARDAYEAAETRHWQASSADDGMRNMERADTEGGATVHRGAKV